MSDLSAALIDVVESLPEGIAIYAADGRPLYCNPSFRAVADAVKGADHGMERWIEPGRRVRVDRRRMPSGLTLVTVLRIGSCRPKAA